MAAMDAPFADDPESERFRLNRQVPFDPEIPETGRRRISDRIYPGHDFEIPEPGDTAPDMSPGVRSSSCRTARAARRSWMHAGIAAP